MRNRSTASSSRRGHPAASTESTSQVPKEEESESVQPQQSRKRPAPSSSDPTTAVITSPQECNGAGAFYVPLDKNKENSDFMCSICMEYMSEPTITQCGHTYCMPCIFMVMKGAEVGGRCPKCGTPIEKNMLTPNLALLDVMARVKRASHKAVAAEIFETSASLCPNSVSPPTDLVKLLTSVNYEHLNLNDLDRLLLLLHRRREIKASGDEEYQRKLLHEFLSQLLKVKSAQIEQLQREVSLINRDVSMSMTYFGGSSVNDEPMASTSSSSKVMNVESCSSSSGMVSVLGFNTQPLWDVNLENQSLAARKKRMHSHFNELTQVYLDSMNGKTFNNGTADAATVSNEQIEMKDMEILENFGRTLSHITQYHGLKPLATLSYSHAMLSNSNIVSSIEFDKDNEFFAIAGVTKKVKLFEYVKAIASVADINCPSSELSCDAKISCVAWSDYYKNNLASSDYTGCVSLWDVATSTRVRSLLEHEKRAWSVDWSKGDPRLLASGSDDSKVKLWSTNSERSIGTLVAKANVCCVKFCPESTYVVAYGSADHCVHYYDLRSPREPLGVLYGHKKAVSYVKFTSKDQLVSASTDSSLKFWNLDESMSCAKSLTGHINDKHFVGLATDGNYIACGSENNSLYLYHKFLPKPLFSFKFEHQPTFNELPKPDEPPEFVSAVAWKRGSPVLVAANSLGAIKILELI